MRATTVARRLLWCPRLSVRGLRFETDELDDEALVIDVAVRGRARCGRCGRKCPRYDWLATRRWRHLDFGAWRVFLEARLCRVQCRRCGVNVEQVSWADARSRFTKTFEDLVACAIGGSSCLSGGSGHGTSAIGGSSCLSGGRQFSLRRWSGWIEGLPRLRDRRPGAAAASPFSRRTDHASGRDYSCRLASNERSAPARAPCPARRVRSTWCWRT